MSIKGTEIYISARKSIKVSLRLSEKYNIKCNIQITRNGSLISFAVQFEFTAALLYWNKQTHTHTNRYNISPSEEKIIYLIQLSSTLITHRDRKDLSFSFVPLFPRFALIRWRGVKRRSLKHDFPKETTNEFPLPHMRNRKVLISEIRIVGRRRGAAAISSDGVTRTRIPPEPRKAGNIPSFVVHAWPRI